MGSILVLPVGMFLFFRPDFGAWTHPLKILSYVIIISLGGSGALLAVLTRAGIVQFIYCDADKQTMSYKMKQSVAEMEQIQKRDFSDSYYDGLGVKPPKRDDSDDKPHK